MKLFPKDATTVGEKAVYVITFGGAGLLYLFMQLSAFGVFHNFYSDACKAAGWGWKVPGLLLTALLVYNIYKGTKDEGKPPSGVILAVLTALSLAFYCGFAYPYWSE